MSFAAQGAWSGVTEVAAKSPARSDREHCDQEYDGTLEVDQAPPRTVAAKLTSDGRSVRQDLEGIVARHVHAFDLRGIESKNGAKLLHTRACCTVNHIPMYT